MARSIWHGAISFGLVHVPVDLFSASKENALPLHLLDSRDFSPVGNRRVNKSTGKEVAWEKIIKGYEYEKGKFVALSDQDFKHANVKATETIEIVRFTAGAEIPPMYFETPYYLVAGKGGEKPYALLRKVLDESNKVAVAHFVMRGRQHLCVVAPNEQFLMLLTLRFAGEILPPTIANPAAKWPTVSAAELAMAKQVVAGMSGPFNPAQFKDTYKSDLMRRIKEKIKKKQTHSVQSEEPTEPLRPKAEVIDLMTALKSSLKMKNRKRA